MTLDIAKFHRTAPICPAHKRWFVMQSSPGNFYMQHCCPFGASPSESNAGEVANATVDIWQELGVGPSPKWCDDIATFVSPIFGDGALVPYEYPYDRDSALEMIAPLRVPWHPLIVKGQKFAPSFVFVGLLWNILLKNVSLPEPKRLKFLERVLSFIRDYERDRVGMEPVMMIHGSLCHISFVYILGRSHLPSLSSFISTFDGSQLMRRYPPRSLITDLRWWADQLQIPSFTRSLSPRGPLQDLDISVDASSNWGIGVKWGDRWAAWKTAADWRGPSRDIGWLECLAVELISYILELKGIRDSFVRIWSDNQGPFSPMFLNVLLLTLST